MRLVILHYHFLKNAGMSVESMLHRSFGSFFASVDTEHRDGHVTEDALIDYLRAHPLVQAVSSHQIRYPVPQAAGFLFYDVCFLRDPLDRVRSTYDYFRDKPSLGDPVSDLANQLGLGEFAAALIRQMPWYVTDAQVNLLANGIANDVPAPGDFDRAVAKMLRTSFLGVVDRFQESLAAGRHFLRPLFPTLDCTPETENVSAGGEGSLDDRIAKLRGACGPRVFAELAQRNAGDSKLLELARREISRRLRVAEASR